MKNFILEEIKLISNVEQTAKSFNFTDGLNVITGHNGVGKSCLIKSIYWTFGAEPHNLHKSWVNAKVSSLVTFRIGQERYKILRDGKFFFIFDEKNNLLERFDSVTKELAPYISKIFNFELKLPHKGEDVYLPPAYYLSPFYVDQDGGWKQLWSSFDHLKQFTNWRGSLIDYFTGSLSDEYLQLKNNISRLKGEILEMNNHKDFVSKSFEKVQKDVSNSDFDIDVEDFKVEVNSLLRESEQLHRTENEYKEALINLSHEKSQLEKQLQIVEGSLKDLQKDTDTTDELTDEVTCPTCGEMYHNDFSDRFYISKDLYRCQELVIEIRGELKTVEAEIKKNEEFDLKNQKEFLRIMEILNKKKGTLKLNDYIKKAGEKHLRAYIRDEIHLLRVELDKLQIKLTEMEKEKRVMYKSLLEKKQAVKGVYLLNMKRHLHELSVDNLTEESYDKIDRSNIIESGSDLPRAFLAYFFSIIEIINQFYKKTTPPIIIDSPNQQDQDTENIQKIYKFIIDNRPQDTQLILGLADGGNYEFGDANIIVLETKNRLLVQEEYAVLQSEFTELLNKGLL